MREIFTGKSEILLYDSASYMRLPIQVEAILFKRNYGRIQYLTLKTIPPRGEFWQPITGGVEEGETKIEALKREVKEETGITSIVKVVEHVHYFEFQDHTFMDYLRKHGRACRHLKEYAYGVEVPPDGKLFWMGRNTLISNGVAFRRLLA